MIEVTKENINNAKLMDKHWKKPAKKLSKDSKMIMYLTGAVAVFTIANVTLIYSFYKILMKL